MNTRSSCLGPLSKDSRYNLRWSIFSIRDEHDLTPNTNPMFLDLDRSPMKDHISLRCRCFSISPFLIRNFDSGKITTATRYMYVLPLKNRMLCYRSLLSLIPPMSKLAQISQWVCFTWFWSYDLSLAPKAICTNLRRLGTCFQDRISEKKTCTIMTEARMAWSSISRARRWYTPNSLARSC